MRKTTTLLLLTALTCGTAYSQTTELPDSAEVEQLHEIVIEAPKIVRKADMDVLYPSRSAVENSRNGMQLLQNLMIPSLTVSDVLGTVKAAGQSVQVRINGRLATIDQVRTLLPETIKRVEWMDNPGLRYGGANYVLNFIVINPAAGGSFGAEARQALNQGWGYYELNAKFNNGPSQFSLFASNKVTEKLKIYRDYDETFTFPDGSTLTRTETPLGGRMNNTLPYYSASYSYIKPDTTVFEARLTNAQHLNNLFDYEGRMSISDGSHDILLTERNGDKGNYPELSLYLQQHFAHSQLLVIDFSASLYFGRTWSDYMERLPEASTYLNDIHTNIRDRNQAYGIEANYIKKWNNSRLTVGATYKANRNRSEYLSLDGLIFHQKQDKVYAFAEYFQRLGKFTATAGMGVQYTDFLFRESDRGNHSWSPRPQATVTYAPVQNHSFRLSFTSWQSTPSLAETNEVPQQLDGFQWRVGNPALKTANSYMLSFTYRFNVPRVAGSFGIRAFNSPNAITPLLFWEGERLVQTYENSRGLKNLSVYIAPQIEIIPGWLEASGYVQFRTERMRGTGYNLTNSAWNGNVSLQLSHRGFTLSGQYMRAMRDLWGESISWGEDISIVDLRYNLKSWQFGAGVIMPFGKYDQGSISLSKWNRNEKHMRLNMRMPYLSVSYNVQWGRQKRGVNKLINADSSTDASKAGGR